jgi:hypothetical protein
MRKTGIVVLCGSLLILFVSCVGMSGLFGGESKADYIPAGEYYQKGLVQTVYCTVYSGEFTEYDAAKKTEECFAGRYEIKDQIVYVKGEKTDYRWDGKTLTRGTIKFQHEGGKS